MKISTQKAIGWVLLCMGFGGVVLFLWIIGLISVEDSRVPGEVVEWAVVSGVMATGALIMLIRCYRRESLGGRKILHLSLADLIVSSVFAAFLMGIGHVYLSEMEFLLLVVPAVLLAMAVLLAGLMLAGREGLNGRRRYLFGFGFVPLVFGVLGLGAVVILAAMVVMVQPSKLLELLAAIFLLSDLSGDDRCIFQGIRAALIGLPAGLSMCWLARRGWEVKKD
jgi:hypothetical protein